MKIALTRNQIFFALALFTVIVASRILPHAANISPVLALMLFSGTLFSDKKIFAYFVPVAAVLVTDYKLEFYDGIIFNYVAYAWIIALGVFINPKKVTSVAAAGLGSSLLFFIITNLGVWMQSSLYPKTWDGLVHCFVMAIPFFHNTIISNMISVLVIYGAYNFILARQQASVKAE